VLAVSAKRYALANRRSLPSGGYEWIIRKASGHGLGHITAPAYDQTALPPHPAAPLDKKTGKPDLSKLSNSRNPKLVCDLWRIAFEAAGRGDDIEVAVRDALSILPGLNEPQFQQRALSSRADWLAYNRLPDKRAFMFFNVLPAPVRSDWTFVTDDPEIAKTRGDLLKTTLYAKATKDSLELDGLSRSDNNEFPAEIFHDAFGLRLCTVADCLWDYFGHLEMKSRGDKGKLERLKLVVLDHEYIGKETNSLIDPDVEEAGDEQVEDLPNVPIFRHGFNPSLLTGLDLDALSVRAGVKADALRKAYQRGRRLERGAMKRLRASLEVNDDGDVSIAEAAPLPAKAQRAARMARQLRTLQEALAKGKDFDLNGTRRPPLENRRRGPVPLAALRIAVERHLPDKAARHFLKDRIGVFWSGGAAIYADNEREIALIEEAIALASGAKRAAAVRRASASKTAREKGAAEEPLTTRQTEAERKRQARAARKAAVEALFAAPLEVPSDAIARPEFPTFPLPPGEDAEEWTDRGAAGDSPPASFSAEWAAEFWRIARVLFVAFVLFIVLQAFPREVEAARQAAIRRASPNTARTVFFDVLRERIEKRLRRAETERLRKRRTRRAKDKLNHPSGDVVQKRARRRAFGDDDAQKIASETDASARVVNADKVAAAELVAADEGKDASLD
jgi:hypothetical protein